MEEDKQYNYAISSLESAKKQYEKSAEFYLREKEERIIQPSKMKLCDDLYLHCQKAIIDIKQAIQTLTTK